MSSERDSSSYVITGVRSGKDEIGKYPWPRDGKYPWPGDENWLGYKNFPRKEFRDLDPDHLFLYLRALQKLQSFGMEEKLGWFQIAGIHGQPNKSWDGKSPQGGNSDGWEGYCTHATALFPTWHRAYLLLLEQRLQELMIEIIVDITRHNDPDRIRYLKAAYTFRLPYWDWLQDYIPSVDKGIWSQDIQFGEINPLDSYRFPDTPKNHGITSQTRSSDGTYIPFQTAGATMRQPPRYDPTNAASVKGWAEGSLSNNQAVLDELKAHPGIKQDVYNLFAHVKDYLHLSNSADPDASRHWNDPGSLEGIHNLIHRFCGGESGHMSFLEVAALDPIFFLHHTNVDRLAALWQAHYSGKPKDNWWTSAIDHNGTWDRAANSTVTPKTPLTPFRKDKQGNYWNSDECRELHNLGYTYRGYPGWSDWPQTVTLAAGAGEEQPSLAKLLNKYNTVAHKIDKLLETHGQLEHRRKYFAADPRVPVSDPSEHRILAHHTYEYDIHVSFERLELGPFSIHFFLGKPSDDPATWSQHQGHIGSVYNFVSGSEGSCSNCDKQREKRLRVVHSVSITNALLDRLKVQHNVQHYVHLPLATMEGTEAEYYLKENLHWAISSYGDLIPTERLTSLQITVSRSVVKLPLQVTELSERVGDREKLEHITQDKVGGKIIIGE